MLYQNTNIKDLQGASEDALDPVDDKGYDSNNEDAQDGELELIRVVILTLKLRKVVNKIRVITVQLIIIDRSLIFLFPNYVIRNIIT